MKRISHFSFWLILSVFAATASIVGCSQQKTPDANPIIDFHDKEQVMKSLASPTIASLSGAKGFNTSSPSNSFGSYFISELNGGSSITVNGANFGATKGTSTITFEKYNSNGTWSTTSSYSVSVVSWSNSQIVVKLQTNTSSLPIASARFKITTSGGTATYGLSTVPYIWTRQYEQCTWWTVKRTIEKLGAAAGWSSAYTGGVSITANYVPTANDVLYWTGSSSHQAFIESVVSTNEGNGVMRYNLTITEANVPWSGNSNTTAPQTYPTTIKIKTVGTTKSFVSGFSTYRSTKTTGANQVRIQ